MDRRFAVMMLMLIIVMNMASSTAFQPRLGLGLGPEVTEELEKQFGHSSHSPFALFGHLSHSPFATALETLQKQINYNFLRVVLLRRAMTHASFSEENNRALSILGMSIIETSVSFQYLVDDIDISSTTLNRKIQEVSNVESSCAAEGMRLGLHKVIRVSHNTNSTTPAIVCGAFRAIFGAIALDSGKTDDAGKVFWNVYSRKGGSTASL